MIIEKITLTKRMTVILNNDEITLLTTLLSTALDNNSLTVSGDDTAATMLNALRKVTTDE